jgi:hypothetical protein
MKNPEHLWTVKMLLCAFSLPMRPFFLSRKSFVSMSQRIPRVRAAFLAATLLALFVAFQSRAHAATYIVGSSGNYSSIQACLNVVQPGDTCSIRGGTYNESLRLTRSGAAGNPITITNYGSETVTVNSGNSKTLEVANLNVDYYTIDGLRLITSGSGGMADSSVDLRGGWISNNQPGQTGGNNGFILRNCYVQGSVTIYGSDNIVENCTIDGNNQWGTGIFERGGVSNRNVFRGNIIRNFPGSNGRGIWSQAGTSYAVIEDNVVYNIGHYGLDFDGANFAIHNGVMRGNTVYNINGPGWAVGIFLENCLDCDIDGNTIHDTKAPAIAIETYGKNCGFEADEEFRDDFVNTIFRNNVISNSSDGIYAISTRGVYIYNNTINDVSNFGIHMIENCGWTTRDFTIRNNIISNAKHSIATQGGSSGLTISDNLFYNSPAQGHDGSNGP